LNEKKMSGKGCNPCLHSPQDLIFGQLGIPHDVKKKKCKAPPASGYYPYQPSCQKVETVLQEGRETGTTRPSKVK
jgi:hypothetical protein